MAWIRSSNGGSAFSECGLSTDSSSGSWFFPTDESFEGFLTAPSGCLPMLQGLSPLPAGSFGSAVASVKDEISSGGWIMVTANRGDLQRKIDWNSSAWNSKTEVRWGTPTRGSNHNPATVRVGLSGSLGTAVAGSPRTFPSLLRHRRGRRCRPAKRRTSTPAMLAAGRCRVHRHQTPRTGRARIR